MSTPARRLVIDPWTPLSHKAVFQDAEGSAGLAPTWTSPHRRRLNAYLVLASYMANVAREWLPEGSSTHREYGDASAIRDAIRAAVLGDDFRLVIDGSEIEEPEKPDEASHDDVEGGESFEEATAEWEAAHTAWQAAGEQQEWLDDWTRNERVKLKVIEAENDAVGLGDAVYYLSWSNQKNRVRLRVYDPGFYFPVWTDDDEEYPDRVHLAWEYEEDTSQGPEQFVRRITFELLRSVDDEGNAIEWTPPYQSEPSQVRCYMTDRVFRIDEIEDGNVDTMTGGRIQTNADGEPIDQLDLGIDFVPIVHLPNTIAEKDKWGESSLTRIAQLLDDLGNVDSDSAATASIVGSPPITISGSGSQSTLESYGPGQVFYTGDGRMDVMDTSRSMDALLKWTDHLIDRLSVNRQTPRAILGYVDASDVPSGVALLLSFTPFQTLVGEMRLVREDKYRLLTKFVQRLAIVGDQDGIESVSEAKALFGSFLPTDLSDAVKHASELFKNKLLSRATALRMLIEAGVPVQDAEEELTRIEREDFGAARELADATGDEAEARRRLGLEDETAALAIDATEPPVVDLAP